MSSHVTTSHALPLLLLVGVQIPWTSGLPWTLEEPVLSAWEAALEMVVAGVGLPPLYFVNGNNLSCK